MRQRQTLEELLAGIPDDYQLSEEERAWLDMPPVGREYGGPECPYTGSPARQYADFALPGYRVPEGYRLLKRTDTARNLVYLDAPFGTDHSTAFLIVWWFPKRGQARVRFWRSNDPHHQPAIGDLPHAFVAQLVAEGIEVQLVTAPSIPS